MTPPIWPETISHPPRDPQDAPNGWQHSFSVYICYLIFGLRFSTRGIPLKLLMIANWAIHAGVSTTPHRWTHFWPCLLRCLLQASPSPPLWHCPQEPPPIMLSACSLATFLHPLPGLSISSSYLIWLISLAQDSPPTVAILPMISAVAFCHTGRAVTTYKLSSSPKPMPTHLAHWHSITCPLGTYRALCLYAAVSYFSTGTTHNCFVCFIWYSLNDLSFLSCFYCHFIFSLVV